MLREERQCFGLQPLRNAIQMIAIIAFVKMRDAIIGEHSIQFLRRGGNADIFCPRIHADGFQTLQIRNVLVNGDQRRVRVLPRQDFRDGLAVAERQINKEGRIFRVRRPRGGGGQHRQGEEGLLAHFFVGLDGFDRFHQPFHRRIGAAKVHAARAERVDA